MCFISGLMGSIVLIGAYAKKPHSLALKRTGIRIVAMAKSHEEEENLCNAAYKALNLLEQYDTEMFDQVIRHIRILSFLSMDRDGRYVPLGCFYSVFFHMVPREFSKEKLPITIAGSLAWHAALVKCNGGIAYFDKLKGAAVKELCRKEKHRTIQKLELVTERMKTG